MAETREPPAIVIVAFPAHGHSASLVQATPYLTSKGFPVYFVGGTEFGPAIKRGGGVLIENTWTFDHENVEERKAIPPGPELLIYDLKRVFLDSSSLVFDLVKQALEAAREQHPGREVVIIAESASVGVQPFVLGAPLPKGYTKLPKIITFHTLFNIGTSKDVFPVGPGLPPPATDEERAQAAAMTQGVTGMFKTLVDYSNEKFKPLGATEEMTDYLDTFMYSGDVTTLQYSPSLDYPRSDLHPHIRFLGLFPLKGLGDDFVAPGWLEELRAIAALPADAPEKKKIIFVSQGTVATEVDHLILPALRAFASRSDLRVVATLGHRGRKLPDDFELPANATVVDYFPYDAILPITDVFVNNAGFGGFSHGVMNGVPMVMSGITQDKPEVSARAEWAGLGINLRAQIPTPEALTEAVDKILADPSYKKRVLEIKAENEAMDPLGSLEKVIWSLVE
ncbi:MGT family glycosyltransferase [Thozetella sp. PMI_491]|nr:MGT family glycosyltransferase [Thozetella sp. PMI_491]